VTPKDFDRRHCLWFDADSSYLGDPKSATPSGGYRVCFDWDAMGRKSTQDVLGVSESGAYIVNFGQHFFAESKLPVHVYSGRIRERFNTPEVEALLHRRTTANTSFRLVWLDTMPFPIRNDGVIDGFADWRTTHRLALYNLAADHELSPLLRRSGGPLLRAVTAVDVLAPLADTYTDNAHPVGLSAALDVTVARILRAICDI
jgi:hypothetical protein